MKFGYYLVDVMDGSVKGTNDPAVAADFAQNDENFVIDTEQGILLQSNGDEDPIEEVEE